MRKISLLFGLLVMSGVMLAGVDENPNLTNGMTVEKRGNVVSVMYNGLEEANITVTIYNHRHKQVFQEKVNGHSSFVRPYNLIGLPKGKYRIVIDNGDEIFEEIIDFESENVEVLSSVIKANKDKFVVTLYSEQETTVMLALRDCDNNLLFSDKVKVKGGNARLFNLADIESSVSVDVISEGSKKSIVLK